MSVHVDQIIYDAVRTCSITMAKIMFNKRLSECDPDETLFSIGLTDVMFNLYLESFSDYIPSGTSEYLPGVEEMIYKLNTGPNAFDEYSTIYAVINHSFYTYSESLTSNGLMGKMHEPPHFPCIFTAIACDLIQTAAKNHNRPSPDVNDDVFDDQLTRTLAEQINLLASRLPFEVTPVILIKKPKPFNRQPASRSSAPQPAPRPAPQSQPRKANNGVIYAIFAVVIFYIILHLMGRV